MSRYFSHTPDWGADFHDTEKEARKAAEDALQEERDSAGSDGWRDEVTAICWGEVRERVVMTERVTREDPDPHDTARAVLERFDEYWSFALRPVEGAAPTWRDLVAQALPLLEQVRKLLDGARERLLYEDDRGKLVVRVMTIDADHGDLAPLLVGLDALLRGAR